MRADMAKVIVERPRVGSRAPARKKGYRKYVQDTGLENLPRREPMLGRWCGREKWLNEHLGPMRRFLRSRVGRPWNKVHQELCEHVSFDNSVQKHVLTHVFQYVERLVEVRAGRVVYRAGRRTGRELDAGQMYVCPTSGLLKIVRRRVRSTARRRIAGPGLTQFHWREGAWWEVRLRRRPAAPEDQWDVWLERLVAATSEHEYKLAYGGKLFAVSKRPLDNAEARALGRRRRRKQR